MLLVNNFLFSLAVALAFSRINIVYGQDDPDSDSDTEISTASASGTRTSTSAGATGTSDLDPCFLLCAQQAAANAGCDLTDQDCLCSSDSFQSDTSECIQDQCPASVVSQAQTLQTQACAAGGASATGADSSRHLAPTGSTARSSSVGHSATTSASAAASAASASVTDFAASGSDLAIPLTGFFTVASVFVGVLYGVFSI